MRYGSGAIVDTLAGMYWERYHAPVFVAETAAGFAVRYFADKIAPHRVFRLPTEPLEEAFVAAPRHP